jgi:hypothetical protein
MKLIACSRGDEEFEQAEAALRERIRAEVTARRAPELARAGWWRRHWILHRIEAEIRQRLAERLFVQPESRTGR